MTSTHAPAEKIVNTDTVTLRESGTQPSGGPEGDVPCATLADMEAFCARLRELRATGDLLLPLDGPLSVTLERW